MKAFFFLHDFNAIGTINDTNDTILVKMIKNIQSNSPHATVQDAMFILNSRTPTVVSAKSDSDVMLCLHCYQGFIIDISLGY